MITTTDVVLATDPARIDNAQLICDLRDLEYLTAERSTLDVTYGVGGFWRKWVPDVLVAHDLDSERAPDGPMDYTALAYADDSFDVVVIDPPYKLNGTGGSHASDARYGVARRHTPIAERLAGFARGYREAARVARQVVAIKTQAQVVSGSVVWLDDHAVTVMASEGWRKADRLDVMSYRPQPPGRRQVHARRNTSSMLVFVPEVAR